MVSYLKAPLTKSYMSRQAVRGYYYVYCYGPALVRKQEKGLLLSSNQRKPSIIHGSMGQGQAGWIKSSGNYYLRIMD